MQIVLRKDYLEVLNGTLGCSMVLKEKIHQEEILLTSIDLNKIALKCIKQNVMAIHGEMFFNMIINVFTLSLTEMEVLSF